MRRPWPWIALAISVCAMSSGGVWFALIRSTPPLLKACWRLTLTAILQLPGFIRDYRRHISTSVLRQRWFESVPLLGVTGVILAVHFDAWSWSVDHTSLTHSLLFVSTTPLILVAWMSLRWILAAKCIQSHSAAVEDFNGPSEPSTRDLEILEIVQSQEQITPSKTDQEELVEEIRKSSYFDPKKAFPPTLLEALGTMIGFSAIVVLAVESGKQSGSNSKEPQVTLAGNLSALLGAAAMGVYLGVGSRMRQWMPLWLYAFPVTFVSAIASAVFAFILEPGVRFQGLEETSLFGWMGSHFRGFVTFGAAFGSGICGHTLANMSLEHIDPLVVSVVLLLEPVVGSFFGYLAGVQTEPGLLTLLSGMVLILGAFLTTIGGRNNAFVESFFRFFRLS